MNNKITNPLLKQLISEIANKATEGRMNIGWSALKESNNFVKKEADEKQGGDALDDILGSSGGDKKTDASAQGQKKPQADKASPAAPAAADAAPKDSAPPADASAAGEAGAEDAGSEDPDKAQADAAKKKAELEKAKAEKAQAEEELEQHSYIKLKSAGGTQFMLGKILNHAFKTNTIDALASEMAQKLKITTPDDAGAFEKDMAVYKTIPGMTDLITSIKSVAVDEPKSTDGEESTDQA